MLGELIKQNYKDELGIGSRKRKAESRKQLPITSYKLRITNYQLQVIHDQSLTI
jgi:hypothetical protein